MHLRGRATRGRLFVALLSWGIVLAGGRARAARAASYDANAVKSALVGKIAAFIEWPAEAGLSDPARPFEIVVLGESPLSPMLTTFYRRTRIAGHNVFVRTALAAAEIGRPHVLFIPASSRRLVSAALNAVGAAPVLTLGDGEGFAAQGVAINFFEEDRRIRFEISRRTLRRHRLQAGYQILQLARLVDEAPTGAEGGRR